MQPDLEIKLLGDLLVLRRGAAVELPPSKKTRALIAYLAVCDRPQRREKLCEMFWEVPDDPRGALRWSLSKIRSILNGEGGDRLIADRNTVAVDRRALATDLDRVRALAARGLDGLETAELRAIADSFRGTFIDDLSLPRCPDFEAWRTGFVNELELVRLGALTRLVDRLADEPDAALGYAHQLQRLAPDDATIPKLLATLADAARKRSLRAPHAPAPAARTAPAEPSAAVTPADALQHEVRFCTTRDGVRVAYAVSGRGMPIVRAAHWMSHLEYDLESPVWRHWIRELSAENTLIRYDERGNGMSEWAVEDLGFEAMVADLESIVDAAGIDRFVLLGVSQGCAVSVAYALRHPERVLGLILYGGYVKGWRARGNPSEIALREAMGILMREGWGRDDPTFRQLFTSLFIPGASREQMEWFNELQRKSVTPENAFRLAESFATIDVADLIGRVSTPTLVIHARGDRVAPISSGKEFAVAIPGARFVELESDNHVLLEGEPAFSRFIDEVRRFVHDVTAPKPAGQAGIDARRHVSILVADIVAASLGFDDDDPEAADAEIAGLVAIVAAEIARFGGVVLDERDGTVTAAFGATRSIEEHAVQACRAALAIAAAARRAGGAKVRMAIDAGEAVVRGAAKSTKDAARPLVSTGPVIKSASRVAYSLHRDVIALTQRARDLAGGFVRTVPLGRDNGGDEMLHELIGENRALSRWRLRAHEGLTPPIGRLDERRFLADSWLAAREGNGRTVSLVGGPGIGKSRMAQDFLATGAVRGYAVVEAGAQEFDEATSLSLIKRVLLSLFDLDGSEDDETVGRAVEGRLAALALPDGFLSPILYVLDRPVREREWQTTQSADRASRIREAFTALALAEARVKPLVALVEDLHWADPESCKALDHLVRRLGGSRVLLLATYRPEFDPGWLDDPAAFEQRLTPLAQEECRAFVQGLLGTDPSLGHLADLVCERTEGVPLFIEETIGALVQTKRIGGPAGAMRVLEPTTRLDIPATVHSVILARLDRLPEAERHVLQIASAVGPVSPEPLLKALSGLGAAFDASIEHLNAAEFLRRQPGRAEPSYVFKHALIQDTTYGSLPADRRRSLHAAILEALERLYPSKLGEQVERLALHALRAEDWERALRYLVVSADRAIERSAYPQAAGFLEQAVAALDHLPESLENLELGVDIRTRMRLAYMVGGDFERAIGRLDEARALAAKAGDALRLAYTLLHASYVYSTFGRVAEALEAAAEARALGLRMGAERHVAEADLAAAQAHMIRAEALPSLALLAPYRDRFLSDWANKRLGFLVTRSVWYLGSLASTEALLGSLDEARDHIAEAVRIASTTERPIDRFAAAYFESIVRIVDGPTAADIARLAEMAQECRERAPFPFHPWLLATLGHARLVAGDDPVATLEAAFEAAERANMPHFIAYASALLSVAHARPGDRDAVEDLTDALRNAREAADPWIEIEVLTALARVDTPQRRPHLRQALTVAEVNGFRPFAERLAALLG